MTDDLYIDVAKILSGDFHTPTTSVGGIRSDGLALLYPGKCHSIVAPPNTGKTMLVSAMVSDELATGGNVLWIDIDHNGAPATVARLRMLGVPADTLSDTSRFRLALPGSGEEIMAIIADNWDPTIVVIDSVGELLPMFGASQNVDEDYTRVHRQVAVPFMDRGSAVVLIDHEAKGAESRAYGATGTIAKKRVIDGVLYRATVLKPFVPGRGGSAALNSLKDRHGYVEANSPEGKEPLVAVFVIEPLPVGARYRFMEPSRDQSSADNDSDTLRALIPPPKSVRDVKERLSWGTTRASSAWRTYKDTQPVPGTFPDVPGNTGPERSPVPLPFRGGTRNEAQDLTA